MTQKKNIANITQAIGNTPLIQLKKISKGLKSSIFAKLEYFNPMGSIKDRIALHMITKAEEKGKIRPGDTIVDNSSGNTALGLAMICAAKGYNLKMVVRDSLSQEKIKFLKALNVELVLVDHTIPPEDPNSYNKRTPAVARETPRGYFIDQHSNPDNNETHYLTTGPEIWEQMEGKIDFLVAGIGTGGTICGVARYLKEQDPDIKVIGIDPAGSVFFDYFHTKELTKPHPYLIEGLGDEFLIKCVDFSLIDDVYRVTDKEAFLNVRRLAKVESVMAGGSSGAALWACLKLAKSLDRPARIVTIFSDSANRYLSTIYNDDWLKEKGIL